VTDAGYGIAQFLITLQVDKQAMQTDTIISSNGFQFLFIGKRPDVLDGVVVLRIIEKGFVQPGDFKQYISLQKKITSNPPMGNRVYHVMVI
jgi:hypothetical protein